MCAGFLDALTAEEAAELETAGRRRRYGAGVVLLHEGDDAGPVVILLAGRCKVSTTTAGREAIVALRGPGDLLGELSAVDGGHRSATVTTLEPTEALVVPGRAFVALLERTPRVALVVLRLVAHRLRAGDAELAAFSTHDVLGRVARRLLEVTERFGEPGERGVEVALALSQEELAAWTGASREGVSKALQQLRSLGIVETGRRRVTVLDLEALRRHAA